MPSKECVWKVVGGKLWRDGLGKKGVDQHSHGSSLDIVEPKSSNLHCPVQHHLLGFNQHVLVQLALDVAGNVITLTYSQVNAACFVP